MKEIEEWLKDLEINGVTIPPPMRKIFEKESAKAIEEKQPYIGVWHHEYKVSKCTCQIAEVYVSNPRDARWFSGWIKYLIGNGIVIDPSIMKKPNIPGAFHCMDKRFPEFVRRLDLSPGASQVFQLPYHIPENVESGIYFGNVFLIKRSRPFPEFVTGAYGDFEVFTCEPDPLAQTTEG
ncbi:MAG: hypothetical protein C00003105_00424 [ANME-2 cluster archaeon HR1]|nr:hypothetical protein C5S42_12575 [ANME-2 cluster archaeon]PPA80359.1 MAG: hypothetical protein C00003105_00424 [ANME-2 cluster archaeon HR1]